MMTTYYCINVLHTQSIYAVNIHTNCFYIPTDYYLSAAAEETSKLQSDEVDVTVQKKDGDVSIHQNMNRIIMSNVYS